VRAAFLARTDLVVENLALRHQLSTFVHCGRRPRVGVADRVFWVTLRRVWARWSEVLLFVRPETVVRCTGLASVSTGRGCLTTVAARGVRPSMGTFAP
jgi:hypothetical protein